MRIPIYAALAALGLAAAVWGRQDPQKEQLKTQLKDTELVGKWIYDDINAGFAQAKKEGKPLLVVFR